MAPLFAKARHAAQETLRWSRRVRKALELALYIDDLYEAFEERSSPHKLTRQERELLENTLAFGEITADEISVPRAEIVAVPESADLKKLLKIFKATPHSRLPVIGKDLDDIKGVITLKDVVAALDKPEDFRLDALLRPLTFVQENLPLPRVLQVMKKTHVPLVLVTDEFGGTSGLISLKDVVEELVGDLDDEHEEPEGPLIVPIGGGRYRVRGDCPLEKLDSMVGTTLLETFGDTVETIGGAVMQVARTVPPKGERLHLADTVDAIVVATDGRRVQAVDIKVVG